ncbi:MAG: FRG domain-containing protein [Phycisphaerales bacterium]
MSVLPTRRWEFLYRLLHFCGAQIAGHVQVMNRRQEAGVAEDPSLHNFAWEEQSASAPEAIATASDAARAWCELFDGWRDARGSSGASRFVFPDVYAVGFFVALLHCDDAVYYRGQRNSLWSLTTSRTRAGESDTALLRSKDEAAAAFMARLRDDPEVRFYYDGAKPPSEHLLAAAQHYQFPTHFLDFTTDFEVAAYFAEGGSDDWHPPEESGAIYAIEARSLPWQSTRLVTLPPCFMRPRLQRGTFLNADPVALDLTSFEAAKYQFKHAPFPLRRGIGDMRWGKCPGLSEFYFPVQDRFESWCSPSSGSATNEQLLRRYREQWLRDTYDLCIYDRGPGLAWANDHHLRLRCRCEPVLAVRSAETMIRILDQQRDEHALASNSGLLFFLRCLTQAILYEGVTPPRMRSRIEKLVGELSWLGSANPDGSGR